MKQIFKFEDSFYTKDTISDMLKTRLLNRILSQCDDGDSVRDLLQRWECVTVDEVVFDKEKKTHVYTGKKFKFRPKIIMEVKEEERNANTERLY